MKNIKLFWIVIAGLLLSCSSDNDGSGIPDNDKYILAEIEFSFSDDDSITKTSSIAKEEHFLNYGESMAPFEAIFTDSTYFTSEFSRDLTFLDVDLVIPDDFEIIVPDTVENGKIIYLDYFKYNEDEPEVMVFSKSTSKISTTVPPGYNINSKKVMEKTEKLFTYTALCRNVKTGKQLFVSGKWHGAYVVETNHITTNKTEQ